MNNDVRQALQQAQKAITTQRVQGLLNIQRGAADMDLVVPQREAVPKSLDYVGARENRSEFYEIWVRKIEAFAKDPEQKTLELPAELNSNDRRELHNLAGNFNLAHTSAGVGPTRRLVLSKDDLFYRARGGLMIDKEGIVALRSTDASKPGSRYHLRRVSSAAAEAGGLGSYQDEAAQEAYEQLKRATNAYENAYSRNPLAMRGGPGAFDQLRALAVNPEAGKAQLKAPVNSQQAIQQELLSLTSGAVSLPSAPSPVATPSSTISTPPPEAEAIFEEKCTHCGNSSELDYPVAEWECVGMCDFCGTERIFKLIEKLRVQPGVAVAEEIEKEPAAGKRGREEHEATDAPPAVKGARMEEANHSNEDEEPIETTTEDTVAIAESNDMLPGDVQWLRNFCEEGLGGSPAAIGSQVVFAMSYGDVIIPRSIRNGIPAEERLFVKVKASPSGALHQLLDRLVKVVFGSGSAKTTMVILPNISITGLDAEAVVYGRVGAAQRQTLAALQSEWGSDGIVYGASLSDDGPH